MVQLVPMTESEFQAYVDPSISEYAQEHAESGRWSAEEAQQKAEEQFQQLLPEGLATKDQYLFTIKDKDQSVGMLWFGIHNRGGTSGAFVYDIRINEQYQRRGYGTKAFLALEEKVRELGLHTISLHVFGHNRPAWDMYRKLGYVETNVMMSKKLTL